MTNTTLRRALGAAAVLWLAASAAAHAATAAEPTRGPEPAPSVLGRVQEASGAPLPNVQVSIPEINRTTTTAADGSFAFRALRPGTYHVDATLLGYAPGHAVVVVPESGADVRVTLILSPTPLAIEGINVTASPGSADPLHITQSTTELSGKALDRSVSTNVATTLAASPGMAVRYAGPAASTPVIRGLSGERVLVLQNGQRTADLSSTSSDHALSVDPLTAARVEVVRGPASLLYGNNALGGVVNVISPDIPTTVPGRVEGFVAGQGESANPGGAASGSLAIPLGHSVAVAARGGFRNVDDVRVGGGARQPNTFYQNAYGVGGVGFVGERVSGGISGGSYRFEYGLPFRPGGDEEGVSIQGHRHEANGRLDVALADRGFTTLRLDGTAQWYGHDEIESSGEIGTRFALRTQTAGLTAKTELGPFSGAVGMSGMFKQYAPEGEEALTPSADSRNGGVFVYQEVPLGGGTRAPRLQLGARYDLYRLETGASDEERFAGVASRTRDFNAFSGSAGLSVPLTEQLSASASVAQSFRAPTVEELYANGFHHAVGTFDIGDPGLKAETNRGAEAVLRAQTARLNAQFSAFYNRIDGFVAPTFVGDTVVEVDGSDQTVPLNRISQADATLRGLEGQAELALSPRWVLGAMGDLVRGDFVDGGDLPFIPAARLGGSVRYEAGSWSAGAEVRHAFDQDRVSQPGCDRAEESCLDIPTAAYTLANLTGGYRLIRGQLVHSFTLKVDNLFDERYRDASSRIKAFALNPGRNVSLVYRMLF
jgi:iron complex outermembrane receptor protein